MCYESTHLVSTSETSDPYSKKLLYVFEQDFKDTHDVTAVSNDDKWFLKITAEQKQLLNEH